MGNNYEEKSLQYDLNGNITTDGLRGVSIAYNILNLPKKVSKGKDNIFVWIFCFFSGHKD